MNREPSPTITRTSRVNQVGSLLHPQGLKDAYARPAGKTDPAMQYWRPIAERLRLAHNVPLEEWRFGFGVDEETGESDAHRHRPHL